jgi:hypothetical protein
MSSSSNKSNSSSVFSRDNPAHRDDSGPSSVSGASNAGSRQHSLHESNREPTSSLGSPAASIRSQESQRQLSRYRRRRNPRARGSLLRGFVAMMGRRTARHSRFSDTIASPGSPSSTSTDSQVSQSPASQLQSSRRPRGHQGGSRMSRRATRSGRSPASGLHRLRTRRMAARNSDSDSTASSGTPSTRNDFRVSQSPAYQLRSSIKPREDQGGLPTLGESRRSIQSVLAGVFRRSTVAGASRRNRAPREKRVPGWAKASMATSGSGCCCEEALSPSEDRDLSEADLPQSQRSTS